MDISRIAERHAGRITFWGEVSRQHTLPRGTPDDVRREVREMKEKLFVHGGGLIGQSEINRDVPLENVEAFLNAWN
jgi:uroporphyrinogen decarboxylase